MGTSRKMKVYQTGNIGTITVDRGEWIDVVGADDLPEACTSVKIVKEKASLLLWGKFLDEDKDFLDKILIRHHSIPDSIPLSNDYRRRLMHEYMPIAPMEAPEKYEKDFIDMWQYDDDFFDIEMSIKNFKCHLSLIPIIHLETHMI